MPVDPAAIVIPIIIGSTPLPTFEKSPLIALFLNVKLFLFTLIAQYASFFSPKAALMSMPSNTTPSAFMSMTFVSEASDSTMLNTVFPIPVPLIVIFLSMAIGLSIV